MKLISKKYINNQYRYILLCGFTLLLNGCDSLVILNPKGDIGLEERSLILTAFGLMLIIIVPVIIMTVIFAKKYRASNVHNNQYHPNWSESKKIEFFTWSIPIVIVIILSILTWKSSHKLDPKNSIICSEEITPIVIHVIALDWKWLFIYPEHNIAVINELTVPAHTPICFNITSNAVMNSFFIPQLGSQIYAMAGMRSKLNLIANEPGKYQGISANFSGPGFSGMKFTVIVTQNIEEFNKWINVVQMSTHRINDMNAYEELTKPSQFHPVTYFAYIKPNLFSEVIHKFMNQNKKYN